MGTIIEAFRRLGLLLETGHLARCPACTGAADAGYYTGEAHADLLATYGVELDHREMRGATRWTLTGTCPCCGADHELDGERSDGSWRWVATIKHRVPLRVGVAGELLETWLAYQRATDEYRAAHTLAGGVSPQAALAAYKRAAVAWREAEQTLAVSA